MTETPWMVRVDPSTLLVRHREFLAKTIAVHMSTAHPHFEKDGTMYNLGTAFNPPNNYNIIRFPPPSADSEEDVTSQAQLVASLKSRWMFTMGYNHSFGMSRDHFVVLEQPIAMSSVGFLTNNWRSAAPYDNYKKFPKEELIFRIIRRSDNKEMAVKYRAATAFTFHFVNCYEDQGHLVVDFVGYSDLDIIDELYVDRLDKDGIAHSVPYFRRYVLPLNVEKAEKGTNLVQLSDTTATAIVRPDGTVFLTPDYIIEGGVSMELPRIHYEKVNATKYRYVYGTTLFSKTPQLVKLDLQSKEVHTWRDEGYQPGEPVYIPSPGATREDEGVILSPVLSLTSSQRNYLLVLDAASFQEVARCLTPPGVQMSVSFHGSYVQSTT